MMIDRGMDGLGPRTCVLARTGGDVGKCHRTGVFEVWGCG